MRELADSFERFMCPLKPFQLSLTERHDAGTTNAMLISTATTTDRPAEWAIQTAILRLVAVREAGNVNTGSARLGISHVALTKWLNRRGFAKLEAARSRKRKRARATTRDPARRATSRRAPSS